MNVYRADILGHILQAGCLKTLPLLSNKNSNRMASQLMALGTHIKQITYKKGEISENALDHIYHSEIINKRVNCLKLIQPYMLSLRSLLF